MPQSFTFRIGRFFGRLPWYGKLAIIAIVIWPFWLIFSTFSTLEQPPKAIVKAAGSSPASNAPTVPAVSEEQRKKSECAANLTVMKETYAKQYKASQFWDASLTVRRCSELLDSKELKSLYDAAAIQSYLSDINNPKVTIRDRVHAMEGLLLNYPEVGSKYKDQIPKLTAQADRKDAEEKRRLLKSEGVRIGMSDVEVVASSWGKPRKINTTTTASGSREQWVYEGGGYLYFEGGKLVAIQN